MNMLQKLFPRSKLLQLGSTLLLSTFFEWGSLKKGSTPKQIPVACQGHKQEKGCRASKVTRQVNGTSPTNFGLVVACNYACKGHCVQIVVSTFNPLALERWSHGRVLSIFKRHLPCRTNCGVTWVGSTWSLLSWLFKKREFWMRLKEPLPGPAVPTGSVSSSEF